MPSDIRDRLEKFIQEEDKQSLNRLKKSRRSRSKAEQEFEPIKHAAEEMREQLRSMPSIKFTINPDSVWITLAERELWFTYDTHSRHFVGEESGHSWFDGEPYADRYEWSTVEECTDAMIRSCAKYVRMTRAIKAAEMAT